MFQRIGQFVRKYAVSRIRAGHWLQSRYTRSLEDEVARLRAENRALVNSILGVAGIPPMRVAGATRSVTGTELVGTIIESSGRGKHCIDEGAVATERVNIAASDNRAVARQAASAAVRRTARRSWQQIARALAVGDARAAQREREADAENFPAPRRAVPRL